MAEFSLAIPIVLENEGSYINDVSDPGGETKYGISKRSYPDLDIKNLTKEDATAIYLRDFWKFDGITSQPLATKLFDAYVNMKHNAIKIMQRLVGAEDDGSYGPITEKLINLADPARTLANFRYLLVQYYFEVVANNPAEAKDLKGWLTRARQ